MGSREKLCFCITISNNAFWGSLLSVIDGWLKHLYHETTARAEFFSFSGNFWSRDDLVTMNSYISFEKIVTTRYDWENLSKAKEILRQEQLEVPTSFSQMIRDSHREWLKSRMQMRDITCTHTSGLTHTKTQTNKHTHIHTNAESERERAA